jgi:transposase
MKEKRKQYPSDVSDEEWAFCAAYLTLMTEVAPQRVYPLREIFNALRYQVKMGGSLADDAARFAALEHRLSANPALDQSGLFRSHGP